MARDKKSSYPITWGILIGLLLGGALLAMEFRFPWLVEGWDLNKTLVQGAYFTAGFFGCVIYAAWSQRHRRGFWLSTCAFFAVHVIAILFFSTYIQPLLVWQWVIVLIVESWIFAITIVLSTRYFGRSRND
jgi:hypothetical protein